MLFGMAAVRVLVASDDPLARSALTALFADRENVQVVARDPDVVVWEFGSARGVDAHAPAPLLAVLAEESQAAEALSAGARGLVFRGVDADRLAAAAIAVANGLTVLDGGLGAALLRPAEAAADALAEALTPREIEVLQLLAQGLTNRRIAERLGISDHTVKFHVNAILGKLGAQTRTEAIVQAARLGLVIL